LLSDQYPAKIALLARDKADASIFGEHDAKFFRAFELDMREPLSITEAF